MLENLSAPEALMIKSFPDLYYEYRYRKNGLSFLVGKLKESLKPSVGILLSQFNQIDPPIDVFAISNIGKAAIEIAYKNKAQIGSEAIIEPISKGFLISVEEKLNLGPKRRRLRSTIAHELAHTFFYDTSFLPPKRLGQNTSEKMYRVEEDICRSLVREFLMPTKSLSPLLNNNHNLYTASSKTFAFLSDLYAASSDIVAYKLIKDLKLWDIIFIKWSVADGLFQSRTQIKSMSRIYKHITIARKFPEDSEGNEFLLEHLRRSKDLEVRKESIIESILINNYPVKIETFRDTVTQYISIIQSDSQTVSQRTEQKPPP